MSIEARSTSSVAQITTAGAADATKLQGSGKGASGSVVGFGAILAAEEAPVVVSQIGVEPQDFDTKVPEMPVDIAQAATVLIANSQLIPVVPVLPATPQPVSAAPTVAWVGQPDASCVGTALATPAVPSAEDGALLSTQNLTPNPTPAPIPIQIPSTSPSPSSGGGFAEAKEAVRQPVHAMALATSRDAATPVPSLGEVATSPLGPKTGKITKTGTSTGDVKLVASPVDSGKELDTKFFAAMEAMKSMQFTKETQPVVQGAMVLATGLTEQSKPDKADVKLETVPSTYAANAPALGTTSYASTAVADATQVSPEMQVAEQVTYWISQNVQNAELTLDGLGADPVEVSIRMSGNEAQVSFRTDELQTRDLLEGAASHLKELLQNQGLVLSGVSVGASGSGDAGAGHQRPHQGARQTIAIPVETEAALPRRLSTGNQGRSLDLFV
jgi:flagellar hook-length control protein FliK